MHWSPYIAISIATCNKSHIRSFLRNKYWENQGGTFHSEFMWNCFAAKNHNEDTCALSFFNARKGKTKWDCHGAMLRFFVCERFHTKMWNMHIIFFIILAVPRPWVIKVYDHVGIPPIDLIFFLFQFLLKLGE